MGGLSISQTPSITRFRLTRWLIFYSGLLVVDAAVVVTVMDG
jgi:hypothetical protein